MSFRTLECLCNWTRVFSFVTHFLIRVSKNKTPAYAALQFRFPLNSVLVTLSKMEDSRFINSAHVSSQETSDKKIIHLTSK